MSEEKECPKSPDGIHHFGEPACVLTYPATMCYHCKHCGFHYDVRSPMPEETDLTLKELKGQNL